MRNFKYSKGIRKWYKKIIFLQKNYINIPTKSSIILKRKCFSNSKNILKMAISYFLRVSPIDICQKRLVYDLRINAENSLKNIQKAWVYDLKIYLSMQKIISTLSKNMKQRSE